MNIYSSKAAEIRGAVNICQVKWISITLIHGPEIEDSYGTIKL